MSVEQSLSRTRSVHVSVEVKDGATWDTARGDSQMLVHIVGRTLRGQAIDEYQYVNSEVTVSSSSPATTSSRSMSRPSPPTARVTAPQSAWSR